MSGDQIAPRAKLETVAIMVYGSLKSRIMIFGEGRMRCEMGDCCSRLQFAQHQHEMRCAKSDVYELLRIWIRILIVRIAVEGVGDG
jgi:hypothetical protein